MQQLLHIFKKDVRGLWGEVAVFLGALVLACWSFSSGSSQSSPLYAMQGFAGEGLALIAVCYLIARLIHAETIPGSSAFWLTRPYNRMSLIGAKGLFVFVFLHLPVFVAQAVMLHNAGFPVGGNLPALLWMQILVLFCVSLPAVAIAAVTTGLAGFVLFLVGGVASWVAVTQLSELYKAANQSPWAFVWRRWNAFLWVSEAVLVATIAAASLPVIYSQYRARKTFISRALLAAIFLVGVDWAQFAGAGSRGMIQALAYTETPDTSAYSFTLGTPTRIEAKGPRFYAEGFSEWPPASYEGVRVDMNVPLVIKGVAADTSLLTDYVALTFETPDGETSSAVGVYTGGLANLTRGGSNQMANAPDGERVFELTLVIGDGTFYEKIRNKSATARGYIDLFVIGNRRSLTVPRASFPVNLTPAFRCGLENIRREKPLSMDLKCGAAFRWPLQIISVGRDSFVNLESFTPFPSRLRLNPIMDSHPAFPLPESGASVDFTLRQPVSFIRKEFEIHDVRLIEGPSTNQAWGIRQ